MQKIILIADDAKLTQQLVSFSLADLWCRIEIANNGQEALEKLRENDIDLLIVDYMMPEMSGVEVVKELRAEKKYQDLPIIMLTSRGQSETQQEVSNLGISCFLTKPFSPIELAEKVKELLRLEENLAVK